MSVIRNPELWVQTGDKITNCKSHYKGGEFSLSGRPGGQKNAKGKHNKKTKTCVVLNESNVFTLVVRFGSFGLDPKKKK